ncbi:MAG: molecular chaperone HtpG [Alphaproteobacteria bacterium]
MSETIAFEAEVGRILHIVTHALYSDREVFLRELISNAADASDKLRYLAVTEQGLLGDDPDFKITIERDDSERTLTISDNGIGMNEAEMHENLGTIAKSGTAGFVEALEAASKGDVHQIGQFGVGFYSAFMVADKVEVISRRAGEDAAWHWVSDGGSGFSIDKASGDYARGTRITLHLKPDAGEFLDEQRLEQIITRYSDHIAVPIHLKTGPDEARQVNAASAIWMRPKASVTEDQHKEFYQSISGGFDTPWLTLHNRVEGMIEYSSLLYIPSMRPFDLFDPARKHSVKLYVRRVYVTDNCEGLVPAWLRFMRGVVDSEDLPLNVSRQMLQTNPMVAKIRKGLTKRIVDALEKEAKNTPDRYSEFWSQFGAVVKEGLYEEQGDKTQLFRICRFTSTHSDEFTSLADYVSRMKDGQTAIYYITGEDIEALKQSPQLEGFKAKGVEVLLLDDPIDDFWLQHVRDFEGRALKSVTRGGADLALIKGDESASDAENKADEAEPVADQAGLDKVIAAFRTALEGQAKDVRTSERLTTSAVCLVADDGDVDLHLAKVLKANNKMDFEASRILELNPTHPLIRTLADKADAADDDLLADAAHLLMDQARILDGEPLPDPVAFSRRMAEMMSKGLLV